MPTTTPTTAPQTTSATPRADALAECRAQIEVLGPQVRALYGKNKAAWSIALGKLCDLRRSEELLLKLVKIENKK